MIERFGAVVSREALVAAAWPGAEATDNNLDVTIGRLRRQLEPAGLRIRTVRSRGYLLTTSGIGT
jgi:DNA-binding winged helix-turn-helix (wHTH) protein